MASKQSQQERLIAHRSKTMARVLQRWMLKRARKEAIEQIKALGKTKAGKWTVSKRESVAKASAIDQELLNILIRFGVAQAKDGAFRIGSMANLERLIDPKRLQAELQSKDFRLKIFTEIEGWATRHAQDIDVETRQMVKDSVRRVLSDAAGEIPQPSPGEMARRIRRQFHGEDAAGRVYAFSPERAELIARTELAQAENTGAFKSYEAANVKEIEWLAKRDGRSGKRHHERMHGKRVKLGEKFTLPSGVKMRYPGDPSAPISETARCRCAHRARIVGVDDG